MTKRKLAGIIASLCMAALIGVGGTLAYFTDNATAENIVTMGHVDLTLTENKVYRDELTGGWVQGQGEEDITEEGLKFDGVVPGETVPKNPTVTLVNGSVDAYVRVRLEVKAEEGASITDADLQVLMENLKKQITEDPNWYYSSQDGYYYFKNAMKDKEKAVLFETVTIPGEQWGNNTAGQSFSILLQAEAVQSDYFTPSENEEGQITGWGEWTDA